MMDTSERWPELKTCCRNRLRGEAIALQKESMQQSLVDETRANIVKAGKVNDQALEMQRRCQGGRQGDFRHRIYSCCVPQLFAVF
jgi:hypothetical protein